MSLVTPVDQSPYRSAQASYQLDVLHRGVCAAGVGRSGQNPGLVLDELQSAVERAGAQQLEGDIGVAVVDSIPTGAPGDDREDDQAETVYQAAGGQERAARRQAADGAHRHGARLLHLADDSDSVT